MAGMRQFYVAYKDREDVIVQLGIGQSGQAFGIIQSELDNWNWHITRYLLNSVGLIIRCLCA